MRQKREERKGRNRRLSSRKQNGDGRKKVEGKRKMQEAKAESKHSWNSCGSETRKGERKRTAKPSKQNRKERTGNQPGEKRKDLRDERNEGAARKQL